MKPPSHQAKLVLLGLLKTASALASSSKAAVSSSPVFSTLAASASALRPFKTPLAFVEESPVLNPRTSENRVVQLRAAKKSDVPSLAHCNEQTLPENYHSRWYHQHLSEWPDLAFVVVENTRVVAYLLGKTHDQPVPGDHPPSLLGGRVQEHVGHVSSLAVLPEFRRQGLASQLLDVFHSSIERRCNYASLHCRQSNAAAVRLYESAGYRAAYSIRNYYDDGEDAFYMKKLFRKQRPSILGRMRPGSPLDLPRSIILTEREENQSSAQQLERDEGDATAGELLTAGTL